MRNVDERVVGMKFDNRQFESGVKTSMNTLESLEKTVNNIGTNSKKSFADIEKGLDIGNVRKSLGDLERMGRSFTFGGMASTLDGLANKFTNLGIVGITTIQNLTNSVVNSSKRMVSALTIQPIMTGFKEYETKMGSIQTILTNTASKGTTMEDVTTALDELNTYADKTIYNFAEMTRNIGTFTAAGVDLDTSKTAIKGIANLAAASGSNAQQASTAMYQLSQALAAGSVKLMDWNSVVNAGMGGELFKNALQDTAKEMGTDVDALIKKNGSFRESLQEGWITADVLNTTLKKMTKEGAKEYADSMVKAGKYTQAQADALLKQAEMAENAATEVKTLTQMFDTMKESVQSGWAQTWEQIIGDKGQSTKTLTAINDAFGSIVGPSADARNAMLKFWNDNQGREAILEGLANIFKTLGDILKPIGEAFRDVFPRTTGQQLVKMSKDFKELTKGFKVGTRTIESIKSAFTGVFSIIKIGVTLLKTLANAFFMILTAAMPIAGVFVNIAGAIGKGATSFSEAVKETNVFKTALEKLEEVLNSMETDFNWMDKIKSGWASLIGIFYQIADVAGYAFDKIRGFISGLLEGADLGKGVDLLNGGIFAVILLGIKKVIENFDSFIGEGKKVLKGIPGLLTGVKDALASYQEQLKAGTLFKIASAIALLAVSLFLLSTIDPERMTSALAGITFLFAELMASLAIFSKFTMGMGVKSMGVMVGIMLVMSTSILLLSIALRNIATLDWDQIANGLNGLAGMMAILVVAAKALSANEAAMSKGAAGLIVFAVAMIILAEALEKIGKLKIEEIGKGLLGIGTLLAGIIGFMKISKMDTMAAQTGAGILLLAGSLLLLATAVKAFGNMDALTLYKGLLSIAILLTQLSLFVRFTEGSNDIIKASFALTVMAGAIMVLAAAVGIMGGMSAETLAKGLGALAISLYLMAKTLDMLDDNIKGAAALIIMAAAIAVLVPPLVLLGAMPLKNIAKALLMLAGVFAIMWVAGIFLGSLTPVLITLAGAIALLGLAVLAIGTGILAFSAGMTALAVSGAAGATVLIGLISGLIGLIPYTMTQIANGILEFARVIGEGAPKLLDAAVKLIKTFLVGILQEIPYIVEKGAEMIIALLEGMGTVLPRIIQAAFEFVIAFVNGFAEALRGNTQPLIDAFGNLFSSLIEFGKDALTSAIPGFLQVGKDIIGGLIKGIKEMIPDVGTWVGKAGTTALNALKKVLGINSPSKEFQSLGEFANLGFIKGLSSMSTKISASAKDAGTTAISSLTGAIGNVSDLISGDMELQPTIRPVLDMGGVNSDLNSAFSQQRNLNLSAARAKATNISTGKGQIVEAPAAAATKNEFNINITGNHIANDYDVQRIGDQLSAQIMREWRRNK